MCLQIQPDEGDYGQEPLQRVLTACCCPSVYPTPVQREKDGGHRNDL